MSFRAQSLGSLPEDTVRVAHVAFPKGNLYMKMRDTFGSFYTDALFADLFAIEGASALAPWHLAFICVPEWVKGFAINCSTIFV